MVDATKDNRGWVYPSAIWGCGAFPDSDANASIYVFLELLFLHSFNCRPFYGDYWYGHVCEVEKRVMFQCYYDKPGRMPGLFRL